tara:strand:- start:106 stop:252 length:147 start_codon:yes stop_codon:yes gene_type:complete
MGIIQQHNMMNGKEIIERLKDIRKDTLNVNLKTAMKKIDLLIEGFSKR